MLNLGEEINYDFAAKLKSSVVKSKWQTPLWFAGTFLNLWSRGYTKIIRLVEVWGFR
jgi:hypothetical protein